MRTPHGASPRLILPAMILQLALFLVAATPTLAAEPPIPDLDPSWCEVDAGHFVLTPAGSAASLVEFGVQVEVWVRDHLENPVASYPRQDIYLYHDGSGTILPCPGGSIADADTDLDGYTTLSGPILGGGWVEEGLILFIAGNPVAQTPRGEDYVLPLKANSPDINGDLEVGIEDITLFVNDLQDYAFRSDFNDDGAVDLSDITIFTNHIGENCP